MRKLVCVLVSILILASCGTVLNRNLIETGTRNPSIATLLQNPSPYEGKLFILGGIVVGTTLTPGGSLVEALYVPVDSRGYLGDPPPAARRYLALYPRERGILDPLIYRRNRQVTIAGVFESVRSGKVDQADYTYPVFRVEEIYLWEVPVMRPVAPWWPYWPGYPAPYWSPFWRYGHPWWY